MKRLLVLILGFVCLGGPLYAAQRFGRPIVSLQNPKDYQYYKLDDVKFPMLSSSNYAVSCLVYRGTEYYYVEVGIENRTVSPVTISPDFLEFDKPGYTVFRADNRIVASELAGASNARFIPTPPPQMPPSSTTTTTVNANATTYGSTTQINGTATSTTTDTSGQAGANFGNAIGNAIAARRFYRAQRDAVTLAQYLTSFGWGDMPEVLEPGKAREIMMTFSQIKPKKAHFDVVIHIGGESFTFKYKE
jgi:hypothetical protein